MSWLPLFSKLFSQTLKLKFPLPSYLSSFLICFILFFGFPCIWCHQHLPAASILSFLSHIWFFTPHPSPFTLDSDIHQSYPWIFLSFCSLFPNFHFYLFPLQLSLVFLLQCLVAFLKLLFLLGPSLPFLFKSNLKCLQLPMLTDLPCSSLVSFFLQGLGSLLL